MELGGDTVTPADPVDIPYIQCQAQHIKQGEKGGGAMFKVICLPKSLLPMMGPCSPGGGWAPACPESSELIPCACLLAWVLLSLLNYLNS